MAKPGNLTSDEILAAMDCYVEIHYARVCDRTGAARITAFVKYHDGSGLIAEGETIQEALEKLMTLHGLYKS